MQINKPENRVFVTIWNRQGKLTPEGIATVTFPVENTTMEELGKFIKNHIKSLKK